MNTTTKWTSFKNNNIQPSPSTCQDSFIQIKWKETRKLVFFHTVI